MVQYTNFYENLTEAERRLKDTVVLYDGHPYYVLCITDHKGDGVFRVYLDKLGSDRAPAICRYDHIPNNWHDEPNMSRGKKMDIFIEDNPDSGILRKKMNSPLFNRFRPFPLGMMNRGIHAAYCERRPTRPFSSQGLSGGAIDGHHVVLRSSNEALSGISIDIFNPGFADMVLGNYPSLDECIDNLNNPEIENESVAFHRYFALIRGPIGVLFLVYKQDIIGYLPDGTKSNVFLGKRFIYTREVVGDLGLFGNIKY